MLVRWRVLCDRTRCELALRTALTSIARRVAAGETMDLSDAERVYTSLFPMDLLDLAIDGNELVVAISARVEKAFAE